MTCVGTRLPATVVAAFLVAACSGRVATAGSSGPPSSAATDRGDVAVSLALDDPSAFRSVQYSLGKGTTTVRSGTLLMNDPQSVGFLLAGVPAGPDYALAIASASEDGGVACLGAAEPFAVVAQSTVHETIHLVCQTSPPQINEGASPYAALSYCGVWQSVSTVEPGLGAVQTSGSEAPADGVTPIVINATATGLDPTSLVYTWTATTDVGHGVTIRSNEGNGTTTNTLTVTCNLDTTEPVGTVTLTLVVGDGDDGGGACPTSLATVSTTVRCDQAGD
jgi:hypothetical protein